MPGQRSTYIKAFILLFVFSLNSMISFACSLGIDLGFNSHHHEEENNSIAAPVPAHDHSPGHKHSQSSEINHDHSKKLNHHHDTKESRDKKDCCTNDVVKFNQLDKVNSNSSPVFLTASFFVSFISAYFNIDILTTAKAAADTKYFVRGYHPPIPDIRIAIQSFQI